MENKINKLIKAAYHYYVLNKPLISDTAYDKLYEEVRNFEERENIPMNERVTERLNLGYFEGKKQYKIEHPIPMLSLNKEVKEVDKEVIITPKLDGVALELQYRKGTLTSKVTRGNGRVGGDVTKTPINEIPLTITKWENIPLVIVRGEVMCKGKDNSLHRNWVAGTLGLKDIYEAKKRELYFVAYFLYPMKKSYEEDLKELEEVGFLINKYKKVPNTEGWVLEDYNIFKDLPTPMDGVVVRYNDNSLFGEHTAKAYKNMWAVKFQDDTALTTINFVEWTQSKNNVWTPVAIIEPVNIDGATIERVNLASLDYINEKNIAIGDSVLVRKAKGVIPEIAEVVDRPKSRVSIDLVRCPSCNSVLVKEGIYLKCKDQNCGGLKKISYFVKELGIKGLGEKRLQVLNLSSVLDIFHLSEAQLVKALGKVGETIYAEIQQVKSKSTVIDLLVALNPPMIKRALLELIFSEIKDINDLENTEKLMQIKGLGEKRVIAFIDWFKKNKHIISSFKNIGFNLDGKETANPCIKFQIAITGSFPNITRKDFLALMQKLGVKVVSAPSKNTQFLVVGDAPSQGKIDKASQLGVTIVDYYDFMRRVSK